MTKQILIVDDSETIRKQVRATLEPAGFAVIEAKDGNEGLLRVAEHEGLALVVCDVNMPNLGGLGFLEAVKRDVPRRLPVLMLTTEGQPQLIRQAREAGAVGWIVKPFKADLLVSAVRKLAGEG